MPTACVDIHGTRAVLNGKYTLCQVLFAYYVYLLIFLTSQSQSGLCDVVVTVTATDKPAATA